MIPRVETYEQALEFLFSRINYERAHSDDYSSSDFKLDRMTKLLSLLGDPQERIPAVHIAGTKGKGSTAAMVSSILAAAGERVGLVTSPHMEAFEERMRVDGRTPTAAQIIELVNQVAEPVAWLDRTPGRMAPTYFEIATALAWVYFEQQQVTTAVLEVGLGGRLDATNVCRPDVSVITSISRDHTKLLGSRLSQIAREKAGIIKPGVPVVSGAQPPEARAAIEDVCRERGSRLAQIDVDFGYQPSPEFAKPGGPPVVDIRTPWRPWSAVPATLVGAHQMHNAAVAVTSVDVLRNAGYLIPEEAVYRGMASVQWPLRIEVLRREPTVIVDAAHNWASVAALVQTLDANFLSRRRVLIFGTSRDKDVLGMLRQLLPVFDTVIFTQYLNNPRAVPARELGRMVQAVCKYPFHVAADPASAWKLAQKFASPADLVCATGSFFLAAEVRELILDRARTTTARTPMENLEQLPCGQPSP